jgi:hypothetical protein
LGIWYVFSVPPKLPVRILDTHYAIRGLTITRDSRRSFVDIEDAGTLYGPGDMVPHTEAWDFMEKLVREINRRLGIGFYDYELRRETIGEVSRGSGLYGWLGSS